MKHLHHIVPKHMGGSDEPKNLVYLTIEEHAEAHRILYEKYGHWQDKIAWQGLSGLITKKEILKQMYDERKGEKNYFYGKKHSEETKTKISLANKGRLKGRKQSFEHIEKRKMSGKNNHRYGKDPWNKGKKTGPQSGESRRKKGKPVIYDGIEYNSLNEAQNLTGISSYKIRKKCVFLLQSKCN